MKKIETIWHHLLFDALENQQYQQTQQQLAKLFGYSLSTVNHALKPLEQIGAIRKESKFFVLVNFKKLLYFWASQRALGKDILYQTFLPANIMEIEGLLPAESIYACYSAARKILGESPADYSKVYFYLEEKELEKVKLRFPLSKKGAANIFVLKDSTGLKRYGEITTLAQTFTDVWNLKDWYGADFIKALEAKIDAKLNP